MILADELLEQFFETFFPQSFKLATPPNGSQSSLSSPVSGTLSGNLTTFANIGQPVRNLAGTLTGKRGTVPDVGLAGGVVEPGSRGLRGVLDNIVTDGMRMAAEMRKRMDEAQKEFERQAAVEAAKTGQGVGRNERRQTDEDDEDEEDENDGLRARWGDQDLLEGAEASSIKTSRSEGSFVSQRSASGREGSTTSSISGLSVKGKEVDRRTIGTSLMDEPANIDGGKGSVEFDSKFSLE